MKTPWGNQNMSLVALKNGNSAEVTGVQSTMSSPKKIERPTTRKPAEASGCTMAQKMPTKSMRKPAHVQNTLKTQP